MSSDGTVSLDITPLERTGASSARELGRCAQNPRLNPRATFFCPLFFLLASWLLLSGCATPTPAPVQVNAAAAARLSVINQTDYEWRLTIKRVSGATVRELRVSARASETIEVAGGDYVIEQTMLPTAGESELSRKIYSHLEPGQAYRWRLATLLSESNGESAAP